MLLGNSLFPRVLLVLRILLGEGKFCFTAALAKLE